MASLNSKRGAIYCRNSGKINDIKFQLDSCKKFLVSKNIEHVETYVDYQTKDNLYIMLEDIKSGKFNYIIVYSLNRLGRKVVDIKDITNIFDENNIVLYTAKEKIDTYDKGSSMNYLLNLVASFAQLEEDFIIEQENMI